MLLTFGKRSTPPCGDCDRDGECTMNCGPRKAEALKPCPFCGSVDILTINRPNHVEAACGQCGSVANVIVWNERDPVRAAYLAGARAMQEAAARILDDYATRRDRIAAIQDQQGRYGYSAENLAEAEQHRRTAAAIRALDPEKVGG